MSLWRPKNTKEAMNHMALGWALAIVISVCLLATIGLFFVAIVKVVL